MYFSSIQTQQIVYKPHDVHSSVTNSGSKSSSNMLSSADASRLTGCVLGRGTLESSFAAGKVLVCDHWVPRMGARGGGSFAGGYCVPGGGGVRSGVGCLCRTGGGAPIHLHLQRIWGFLAVLFWQGRQPSVWFWWIIAGCLSIAAFTFQCPGNSTPRFFSSVTLARGFFIWYCIASIAVPENPPLAILAIFNARRMSDCSSCTQPPCIAIVADMLRTYKKLVAAPSDEIQQWPTPYMLP